MKLLRLSSDPSRADPEVAVALLEAVGTTDFAARVLEAVGRRLPASHCTVFALGSNGRVDAISSASAVGEVATQTAIEYIRLGFDRQDSNMLWLARRKPGKGRRFWTGRQFASEVTNDEYRKVCYGEPGIGERLSLLAVYPEGHRVSVSLYRNHSHPEYSAAEVEWFGHQATLLAAAAIRQAHVRARPQPGTSSVRQAVMSMLSAREREVVSHVLDGCTTKEAARRMGVSVTTAVTYRYRAFHHMGIRSLRELIGRMQEPRAKSP